MYFFFRLFVCTWQKGGDLALSLLLQSAEGRGLVWSSTYPIHTILVHTEHVFFSVSTCNNIHYFAIPSLIQTCPPACALSTTVHTHYSLYFLIISVTYIMSAVYFS